ncbi:MAG TPA: hypothetical protein PKE17_19460 [Saprospiraceae bacterium]|nr:hypothetical protein [Saprospiraceae bacterium]
MKAKPIIIALGIPAILLPLIYYCGVRLTVFIGISACIMLLCSIFLYRKWVGEWNQPEAYPGQEKRKTIAMICSATGLMLASIALKMSNDSRTGIVSSLIIVAVIVVGILIYRKGETVPKNQQDETDK